MSAYLIVNIDVHDVAEYEKYKPAAAATLAEYGGRYLVRGGAVDVLEGDWSPTRLVVLEFKDTATARAWWDSDVYAEMKALRQSCTHTQMVLVEGVAPPIG